jgi:hemolysin activation/secretion protein
MPVSPPPRRLLCIARPLAAAICLLGSPALAASQAPDPHPAAPRGAAAPSAAAHPRFVLRGIRIDGAHSVAAARVQKLLRPLIGREVTTDDILKVADAVGAEYKAAGFALYQVSVPRQTFAGGVAIINVTEGRVADVRIDGKISAADRAALNVHAGRILRSRPLTRAVLEREIQLINQNPGLKVESRFESISGEPGTVRLVLTAKRKRFDFIAGFNNQGVGVLGRTELYTGAAVNSLLQEGDRTEFVFGFPTTFSRYQFYGLTHIAPIGNDGLKLTVNLGDLVTHPVNDGLKGDALIGSATLSYPIILHTREVLSVSGGFDFVNSSNALLSFTTSDERTRSLRAGVSYVVQEEEGGSIDAAGFTLSKGLDIFGARRGSLAFGGPDYTKVNARLARDQVLPWNFALRGRISAQFGFQHLPASEQFIYGTQEYGQSFAGNPLYGDRGISGYGELARKLPFLRYGKYVSGTEVFGFADGARVWNTQTIYQLETDQAASAGFGVRAKVLDKFTLQVAAGRVLVQPLSVPHASAWNALFSVTGSF